MWYLLTGLQNRISDMFVILIETKISNVVQSFHTVLHAALELITTRLANGVQLSKFVSSFLKQQSTWRKYNKIK